MPHYILKLTGKKRTCYLIWSTIVDAPICYDMTKEDVKQYWEEEHGRRGIAIFEHMMEQVEKFGSSSGEAPSEIISCNRAGPNESELSYDEIIEKYVDFPTPSA